MTGVQAQTSGSAGGVKAEQNEAAAWQDLDPRMNVSFKGASPSIADFVSTIIYNNNDSEPIGVLKDTWRSWMRGGRIPGMEKLVVDKANGFVSWMHRYPRSKVLVEYCFWNCSDKKHKLVAENIVTWVNGVIVAGQYSGVSFYMYDSSSKTLSYACSNDLGIDSDEVYGQYVTMCSLPQKGKKMTFTNFMPNGEVKKKFTWNGEKFVLDD